MRPISSRPRGVQATASALLCEELSSGRGCHAVPMDSEQRKPLLGNPRSSLRVEDFCLNTGLDRDTVENLIRERFLEDPLWTRDEPSRPRSIYIDALPSRETLAAMGLPVRDD